jgi:hypothetical protein
MVQTLRERWVDWLVAAVLLGLFGVAVGGSRAAFTGNAFPLPWQPWWDGFLQNSGTEMLGAFLTFILLEVIRGRRERRYQEEADERRMKATKEFVVGLIQMQEIHRLQAAKTPEERQPILDSMSEIGLLQGANLWYTNLEGARLLGANLRGANLYRANLKGADMARTTLRGATHLTVDQLRQAENLEGAMLPDGTRLPDRMGPGQEIPWRDAFEEWSETVGTTELGWIKPADPAADE